MTNVASGPADVFVPTSIANAVDEAFRFAVRFRRATALRGPAGIGKSTTLRRLGESNPHALYGEARNFRSLKYLYQFMTTGYQMNVYYSRSNQNLREIIESEMPGLVANACTLLIDEMQDLDLDTLREVVGFAELYRLPVVLVGNERSLRPRPRMDTSTFNQILSRITKTTNLTLPTPDDYAEFARAHGVADPAAVSGLSAYGQRSSFRGVRDLLAVAAELSGSAELITADSLRTALFFMTDDAKSDRLLKSLPKAA